jgi:hypothetical protein
MAGPPLSAKLVRFHPRFRLTIAQIRLDVEAGKAWGDIRRHRRERQIVLERKLVVVEICASASGGPAKLKMMEPWPFQPALRASL